jgi:hypothetical protein
MVIQPLLRIMVGMGSFSWNRVSYLLLGDSCRASKAPVEFTWPGSWLGISVRYILVNRFMPACPARPQALKQNKMRAPSQHFTLNRERLGCQAGWSFQVLRPFFASLPLQSRSIALDCGFVLAAAQNASKQNNFMITGLPPKVPRVTHSGNSLAPIWRLLTLSRPKLILLLKKLQRRKPHPTTNRLLCPFFLPTCRR